MNTRTGIDPSMNSRKASLAKYAMCFVNIVRDFLLVRRAKTDSWPINGWGISQHMILSTIYTNLYESLINSRINMNKFYTEIKEHPFILRPNTLVKT